MPPILLVRKGDLSCRCILHEHTPLVGAEHHDRSLPFSIYFYGRFCVRPELSFVRRLFGMYVLHNFPKLCNSTHDMVVYSQFVIGGIVSVTSYTILHNILDFCQC
jgi:hypothetical protein